MDDSQPLRDRKDGRRAALEFFHQRSVLFACLALDILAFFANHRPFGLWWPVGLAAGLWAGFLATGTGVVALWRRSVHSRLSFLLWSIGIHWIIAAVWLLTAGVLTYRRNLWFTPFSITRWLDVLLTLAVVFHVTAIWRRDRGESVATSSASPLRRWLTADWFLLAPIIVAIWAVWRWGLIAGADACTHVSRVIQLAQNDRIAICQCVGHAVNPAYALDLWHLVLAIVSKLSGIWPPVLWINLFFLVIPLYYVVIYWAARRLFGSAAALLTVAAFLLFQLRAGIDPRLYDRPWISTFSWGFICYAYNGHILIYLLAPLAWVAAVRFDERNDWRYAALAGGLVLAGLSVHGLGGIFLFGLVTFHFLAGLVWPSAAKRRPYAVGLAIVVALALPRVAWIAFAYHLFRQGGAQIEIWRPEHFQLLEWSGRPAEVFYFVSCLLLFMGGVVFWRRRAIRFLALALFCLFTAVLIPPIRQILVDKFSWVFLTRVPVWATYFAWLVIPGMLSVIAGYLLGKVGLRFFPASLGPLLAAAALVGVLVVAEGPLTYRRAIQQAFAAPPLPIQRKDMQLAAARAGAALGRQFHGRDEFYFFDGPDDPSRLWPLVFGTARTPAPKGAQDLLREIIQISSPTVEMVKRVRNYKVRVILAKSPETTQKVEQMGWRRQGLWKHPEWGEFDMLVWPNGF